jgi:dihydroorotate dehydrogenase electron transfer subunit
VNGGDIGLFKVDIISNKIIKPGYHLIEVKRGDDFPDAFPGQFVSVKVSDNTDPLLRRPYSIMDLTSETLSLLVASVGKGSSLIVSKMKGDKLDIIGPLGGSYFPEPQGEAVFVGGGTGVAPLIYAARTWRRNNLLERSILLYGAECEGEICDSVLEDSFTEVHFSTMDGSIGFCGDVVSLCERLVEEGDLGGGSLYSCGPRRMVFELNRRLGSRFGEHNTSLETVMACGLGACRGCTVPVLSKDEFRFKQVCEEGTVFRADEIAWEEWDL